MKRLIDHTVLFVYGCLLAVVCSCGSGSSDKPVVTVSIPPQMYLLQQISGDKVEVKCLLAKGGDPESYEPSMADMRNLQESAVYMQAGNIPFEDVLISRIKENNAEIRTVNTSEGIELIGGTHKGHDDSHGHSHDMDPHTWSSVKNARVIARNMLETLIEVDSANAKFYRQNFDRLDARLDSLDRAFGRRLSACRGASFVVWHPSLSYFARDYGLHQLVAGSMTKEVSVPALRESIEKAGSKDVKVFFYQRDTDNRQAEVINAQIGADRVDINPLAYQWDRELDKIVDAITSRYATNE